MARRKSIPGYGHHKASDQAVAYVDRKPVYLGKHDSPESRVAYAKLIARLAAKTSVDQESTSPQKPTSWTVGELCVKFVTEELKRYSVAEQFCQKAAIRVLRQLFGETPCNTFGPLRLRVVRTAMVEGNPDLKDDDGKPCPRKPWSRNTVNRQVKRIQSLFWWGVSLEMVNESVATALSSVRILAAGETAAAESEPRRPVSVQDFKAAREKLKPMYQDILDLLSLTGARPSELIGLRIRDVERKGKVWRADLKRHKTAHKGKTRVLYFNAAAQRILLKHLQADPDARFFPCRRDNFGHAVKLACNRAGIIPFVPHEIRHTTATKLVDEVGVESAQQLLGHSDAAMTRHYSKQAEKQALKAVNRLG